MVILIVVSFTALVVVVVTSSDTVFKIASIPFTTSKFVVTIVLTMTMVGG